MASVVFMRGVNVGGHKTFRPAALAHELAAFDVVNIGAAGTFAVRKPVGQAALRAELKRALPFEAELMIIPARAVLELVARDPFPPTRGGKDLRPFVTAMAKAPRPVPRLPLLKPAGDEWQVRVFEISGPFALSIWRRLGRAILYPNEVVEKAFGVSATTRSWDTFLKIRDALEK